MMISIVPFAGIFSKLCDEAIVDPRLVDCSRKQAMEALEQRMSSSDSTRTITAHTVNTSHCVAG